MASNAGTNLTRAELTIMEPPATVGAKPGGQLARVKFQFNPNKLELCKSTEWRRNPSRMAGQSSLPEFVGSGPRSLSVEVFLDATDKHDNSVEERVEQLMLACVPTKSSLASKKPASPWVRFEWGTGQDDVVRRRAVESLGQLLAVRRRRQAPARYLLAGDRGGQRRRAGAEPDLWVA